MSILSHPHEFAVRAAAILGVGVEASITVRQHGTTVRAGSSSEAAAKCDSTEAMSDDGPCIDAMDQMRMQLVPSIDDDSRWTAWRKEASQEGFKSAAAVPAVVAPGVAIALNLYSREPDPWQAQLLTAADSYAQLLASGVRLRFEMADLEETTSGLYRNLPDSAVVERAVGAVMSNNRCSDEEALGILETASANSGITLREVAEGILRALTATTADGTDGGDAETGS